MLQLNPIMPKSNQTTIKLDDMLKAVSIMILIAIATAFSTFYALKVINSSKRIQNNSTPEAAENNSQQIKSMLTDQQMKDYSQYAYTALDNHFTQQKSTTNQNSNNSKTELDAPESYDKLFVTILVDNKIRCCYSGSADASADDRINQDIEQAVTRCINDERFGGVLKEEEIENTELAFNFFYNKTELKDNSSIDMLRPEIELGVHAIELNKDSRKAYFKESVPISKNYSLDYTLQRLCQKIDLDSSCYTDPSSSLYIYNTESFISNRDQDIRKLFRYNTYLAQDEIDNELILERLELTRDWFLHNTNAQTGRFEYMYFPSDDEYSPDNNHVRQLAATWAASRLQNFLEDNSLDLPIQQTISYYVKEHSVCTGNYCYIEINNTAKLGYSAFILLSLIENPDYPDAEQWIDKFAAGILHQQQEDGGYNSYFNSDTDSGIKFYPGEAMLALMHLYEQERDPEILSSVEKAFPYYAKYWRNNQNTAMIPWHTRADYLLHKHTSDEELKKDIEEFVFEINDWLIERRQVTESEYKDEIGGFGHGNPSGVSSATYTEGINDAYRLAVAVDDKDHIEKYEKSLKSAIRFILQTQYTQENSFYIENRNKAVGGFRESLISNQQRIDYQQHAAFALMKAYEQEVFPEE